MYIIGIDPEQVWLAPASGVTPPQFTPGQFGMDGDGNIYKFVVAGANITGPGYVCMTNNTHTATLINTTTSAPGAGQGRPAMVAKSTIPIGGFGWMQVVGPTNIRVAASAAASTQLNSTANSGQLDDDATAGAEVIDGICLQSANGGAAGLQAGQVFWPTVGRTL
jgi:hypothetical protein